MAHRAREEGIGMYELKPCPFCGTVPRIGVTEPTFGEPRYFVECEGTGCKVVAYTPNEYETALEAAEAWNARACDRVSAASGLKPCPFCGGEAKLLHVGAGRIVKCGSCGASTSFAAENPAKEWNRRAGRE